MSAPRTTELEDGAVIAASQVIEVTGAIVEPLRRVRELAAACDFDDPSAHRAFDEARNDNNEALNDAVSAELAAEAPLVWLMLWDGDDDCIGVSLHASHAGAVAAARTKVAQRYAHGVDAIYTASEVLAASEGELHEMLPNLNEFDFQIRAQRLVIEP